ncbi:hypothetical protein P8452_02670 [Trifolium repens]|nr:hypothetical protein P8452_02670 [Trifolium repens]
MEADDFLDSEPDLEIIVNVVSILPREFDICSEITDEEEESGMQMALHRPVCYYAKVNNVGINKVLIDGGAAVKLMPEFLLK